MDLSSLEACSALASDPSTSPELLRLLLARFPSLRHLIAANPATPFDVLASLDDERLAFWLLQNPSFFLHVLEDPGLHRLSGALRIGLARCPQTPPEILYNLLDPRLDWVLLALWENPSLPGELRRQIAEAGRPSFRRALVASLAVPAGLHRLLLSDADPQVRAAMSRRCSCCSSFRGLLRKARGAAEGRGRSLSASEQGELLSGGVWARVLLARQPRLAWGVWQALDVDPAEPVRRTLTRWEAPPGPLPRKMSLRHERRCVQAERLRRELRLALGAAPRGGEGDEGEGDEG